MLGDREAVVTEVKPFDLHGVTYYDLALIFSDGNMQSARLGPEGAKRREAPATSRITSRCGSGPRALTVEKYSCPAGPPAAWNSSVPTAFPARP